MRWTQDSRSGLLTMFALVLLIVAVVMIELITGNGDLPGSAPKTQGPIANQATVTASSAGKDAAGPRDARKPATTIAGPPGIKNPNYTPPASPPTPTPRLGIFPDSGPLPSGTGMYYRLQNSWVGAVNGDLRRVMAGSRIDDPSIGLWGHPEQGAVVFFRDGSEYDTPSKTGSVRITAANGTLLTLESTSIPTRYVFDVATRTWVGSPVSIPREHYCPPEEITITGSPPISTTSYYVYKTGATEDNLFFNDGYIQGRRSAVVGPQSGMVILHFGQPWKRIINGAAVYGTLLSETNQWAPVDEIERAAQFYADGFYKGSNESSTGQPPRLTLLVGLSNYGLDDKDGTLSDIDVHGKNWGEMIKRLGVYASPYKNLAVDAAMDIEFPWNTVKATRNWVDGYSSAVLSTGHFYYDFGGCAGCFPMPAVQGGGEPDADPPYAPTNNPAASWYFDDIRYVSNQGRARALPQIYYPVRASSNGSAPQAEQACQWENVSRWSFDYYWLTMGFQGVVSGWQTSGDATYILTAEDAWKQLKAALHSNPDYVRTTWGDNLDSLTDFTNKGHAPNP